MHMIHRAQALKGGGEREWRERREREERERRGKTTKVAKNSGTVETRFSGTQQSCSNAPDMQEAAQQAREVSHKGHVGHEELHGD